MPKYLVTGVAQVPFEYEVVSDNIEQAKEDASFIALENISDSVSVVNLDATTDEDLD